MNTPGNDRVTVREAFAGSAGQQVIYENNGDGTVTARGEALTGLDDNASPTEAAAVGDVKAGAFGAVKAGSDISRHRDRNVRRQFELCAYCVRVECRIGSEKSAITRVLPLTPSLPFSGSSSRTSGATESLNSRRWVCAPRPASLCQRFESRGNEHGSRAG